MTSKHIILTLFLMLCPIGMAAQSTITRNKPKPAVTKPKPAAKSKAKPKPTPRRNSTHHSSSTSSTVSLSAELNKLINNMVYVSGGTFTMGGTSEQGSDAESIEKLSSYYICKYEVTQALWRAVMGSNPSYSKGDNLPVERVSWDDCQTFIKRLNSYTGRDFRLPTEAEWEFAARGGNYSRHYKYSGSNNLDDVAWHGDNSDRTHPVGTKRPNELGLYDMSGNVFEWCSDWYGTYSSYSQTDPTGPDSGSYCINRGGAFAYGASRHRSTDRNYSTPDTHYYFLGLRLALSQL